jgi:hypothetical protein
VISIGAATGVGDGVTIGVGVGVGNTVLATTETGLSRLKPKTMTNNRYVSFLMGFVLLGKYAYYSTKVLNLISFFA